MNRSRWHSSVAVVVAALTLFATVAACGPDQPAPAAAGPGGATTTAAAPATTPAGARGAVTPDRLCSLLSNADATRISGFTITATKTEMSGDVSVCTYVGTFENFSSGRFIIQYQPHGKGAVEYTKSKGVAVSGLGDAAVWFATSAQLSVEIGGDVVFAVYILDVRFHGSDPRTGATQVAQIVVPALAAS